MTYGRILVSTDRCRNVSTRTHDTLQRKTFLVVHILHSTERIERNPASAKGWHSIQGLSPPPHSRARGISKAKIAYPFIFFGGKVGRMARVGLESNTKTITPRWRTRLQTSARNSRPVLRALRESKKLVSRAESAVWSKGILPSHKKRRFRAC
jgi:hypothetical protein